MTDRIQNLIDTGRLVREKASDAEVAGLWLNALEAFADASVPGVSPKGRLVRAYDAGRLAATSLVRSRDLRVRATNHHEITVAAAGFVSAGDLAASFGELEELRALRVDAEYGWESGVSATDAESALQTVRGILRESATNLRAHRPAHPSSGMNARTGSGECRPANSASRRNRRWNGTKSACTERSCRARRLCAPAP
jgi:hypothetical protein